MICETFVIAHNFFSLSVNVKGEENIEDNLIEKCYCPGDEYAQLIPALMETITRVAREKGKSAPIQRLHVPTPEGLPPIEVLGGMEQFAGFTRQQVMFNFLSI